MHNSFIILCPDCNVGGLRSSVNSIRIAFPEATRYAVVGENAHQDNIKEMEKFCQVHKGGKTITSLINVGVKTSPTEWNFVVMAGCYVRARIVRKYQYFVKDERDILFPVIDRKFIFDEASINGILVNKVAFNEVGDFGDEEEDIRLAKLIWAHEAVKKGFRFKAIVGGSMI